MDDDKVKDELEAKNDADEGDVEDEPRREGTSAPSSSEKKASAASKSPVRADDEDDEDDDEDDEDDDEDEDEDDEEEEERSPKVSSKAKPDGKAAARSPAKAVKAEIKLPPPRVALDIPLPTRNSEVLKGLTASIAGYLAFWYGWSIFSESVKKHHVNFFSHSAWAFMVAFFLVILAGFLFVQRERADEPAAKKPDAKGKGKPDKKGASFGNVKAVDGDADGASGKPVVRGVDKTGVLLAVVVGAPFYGIYWWKASRIWAELYANANPVMWSLFAAFVLLTTWGLFHAMRPPTSEEEKARRMPTRRVLALLMTPFALVYGMIWLASLYPPWPT